jgi:peptidoglycan hydrolase CwlO-like protein
MIKQAAYGVAALGVLTSFVFGRDVWSYARTWGNSVRDSVKKEVPVEFEVARAREMVEHLVPDIRNCMHVIAEQEVDVDQLTAEIGRKQADLAVQKDAIQSRTAELKTGQASYIIAGQAYTAEQVRTDLAKRFDRFKIAEETVKREQQVLEARQAALKANRDKLDNMLAAKTDLELQLEQLEARLKAVQAAETISTVSIDDSELTRAKKLIRDLNKQIDVREKVMASDGKLTDLIPVEAKHTAPKDLESQIETYFSSQPATPSGKSEIKVVNLDALKP